MQQPQGEEPNKNIKVFGPGDTQIKSVRSDLPYLKFKIGEKEQDDARVRWPIALDGFSRAPVGAIDGKVFVTLQDGKELWVSVRGAIEGSTPGAAQAAALPRAEDDLNNTIAVAAPALKAGEAAPEFTASDMDGKVWRLSDLKGKKNLLLTFFPKCFTGGCANHLSGLRDHKAEFDAAQTQILAVSVDSSEGERGQRAFANQWKLRFPLVPDTSRKISMLFGAAQNDKQLAARMSLLIDKQGIVRWVDTDVRIATHGKDVLAKMRELGLSK